MSVWPCYRLSAWYNLAANPIRHYGWEAWAVVNAARFAKLGEAAKVHWSSVVQTCWNQSQPALSFPCFPRTSPCHRCPGETIESKAGGLQLIQAIAGLGPQVRVSWGKPFGMKIGDVFPRFFWMNWHWPFFGKKTWLRHAQTCFTCLDLWQVSILRLADLLLQLSSRNPADLWEAFLPHLKHSLPFALQLGQWVFHSFPQGQTYFLKIWQPRNALQEESEVVHKQVGDMQNRWCENLLCKLMQIIIELYCTAMIGSLMTICSALILLCH